MKQHFKHYKYQCRNTQTDHIESTITTTIFIITDTSYCVRNCNGRQQCKTSPHMKHVFPEYRYSEGQLHLGERGTGVECLITYEHRQYEVEMSDY